MCRLLPCGAILYTGHSLTQALAVIPARVGTLCIWLPFSNSGCDRLSLHPPLRTAATTQPLVVCKEWELSVVDSRIPTSGVIHTCIQCFIARITQADCWHDLLQRKEVASCKFFNKVSESLLFSSHCNLSATYVAYDVRCTGLSAWCVGISFSLPTHAPLCTKTRLFNCYCMSTNQIPLIMQSHWLTGFNTPHSVLVANGMDPPALLVHIVLDMVTRKLLSSLLIALVDSLHSILYYCWLREHREVEDTYLTCCCLLKPHCQICGLLRSSLICSPFF